MMYLEGWKSSRWLRVPPEWLGYDMGWKHIFQYRDVTGLSPESSYYIGTGPVREARCMVCLAPDTTAPRLASSTIHHPVPQSLHYHHHRGLVHRGRLFPGTRRDIISLVFKTRLFTETEIQQKSNSTRHGAAANAGKRRGVDQGNPDCRRSGETRRPRGIQL